MSGQQSKFPATILLYGACTEDILLQRVLEWIRIPSDACGRANSIWIRYVWTGKFLNPERKSCRFKNIRIGVGNLSYGDEFDLQRNARARKTHFNMKECSPKLLLKHRWKEPRTWLISQIVLGLVRSNMYLISYSSIGTKIKLYLK